MCIYKLLDVHSSFISRFTWYTSELGTILQVWVKEMCRLKCRIQNAFSPKVELIFWGCHKKYQCCIDHYSSLEYSSLKLLPHAFFMPKKEKKTKTPVNKINIEHENNNTRARKDIWETWGFIKRLPFFPSSPKKTQSAYVDYKMP